MNIQSIKFKNNLQQKTHVKCMNCNFVVYRFSFQFFPVHRKKLSFTCYSVFPDRQQHTIKIFVPHDDDNFKFSVFAKRQRTLLQADEGIDFYKYFMIEHFLLCESLLASSIMQSREQSRQVVVINELCCSANSTQKKSQIDGS